MKTVLCALMMSVLLLGCAATGDDDGKVATVDGSSAKSTIRSLRMMKGEGITVHCQIEHAVRRILKGDPSLSPSVGNGLGEKLDGMTAQQVIKFSTIYPETNDEEPGSAGNCRA